MQGENFMTPAQAKPKKTAAKKTYKNKYSTRSMEEPKLTLIIRNVLLVRIPVV